MSKPRFNDPKYLASVLKLRTIEPILSIENTASALKSSEYTVMKAMSVLGIRTGRKAAPKKSEPVKKRYRICLQCHEKFAVSENYYRCFECKEKARSCADIGSSHVFEIVSRWR